MPKATDQKPGYENRIVKYGLEPIDNILFHPDNWRIHPVRQQDAVDSAMMAVGVVKPVIINLRTGEAWPTGDRGVETLIDGHMRVTLARRKGNTHIPTVYIDVDPDEERLLLSSLDPLGALAATDNAKLLALAAQIDEQNVVMKAALRGAGIDIRETFAHITGQAEDGQPTGDQPREAQVYENSGQAPAGNGSKPADREKYPLAVVLDRRDYDRWQLWKNACGQSGDTAALKALLDKAIYEGG